jgi:hypothetical protein
MGFLEIIDRIFIVDLLKKLHPGGQFPDSG